MQKLKITLTWSIEVCFKYYFYNISKNILRLVLWKSKFQHGLEKDSKRAYILKNISKCCLFFAVSLQELKISKKDDNNKGMRKSDNLLDSKLVTNVLFAKIYGTESF